MAEVSLGGGKNLPGGGEKIARYLSQFYAFLHNSTNLRPLFWHFRHMVSIKNIKYTFKIFLFIFYLLYESLVPRNVLGAGGAETP